MKWKYIIILISFLTLVAFAGWIYFVSMFSSVYPPIKDYKFQVSASNLRTAIVKSLENYDRYEYNFTDTVGSEHKGYAFYIIVRIKGQQMDNEYTFKYYSKKLHPNKSKIDLISAFDKINKTGGFKLKDPDVKRLVEIFDNEFIDKLILTQK